MKFNDGYYRWDVLKELEMCPWNSDTVVDANKAVLENIPEINEHSALYHNEVLHRVSLMTPEECVELAELRDHAGASVQVVHRLCEMLKRELFWDISEKQKDIFPIEFVDERIPLTDTLGSADEYVTRRLMSEKETGAAIASMWFHYESLQELAGLCMYNRNGIAYMYSSNVEYESARETALLSDDVKAAEKWEAAEFECVPARQREVFLHPRLLMCDCNKDLFPLCVHELLHLYTHEKFYDEWDGSDRENISEREAALDGTTVIEGLTETWTLVILRACNGAGWQYLQRASSYERERAAVRKEILPYHSRESIVRAMFLGDFSMWNEENKLEKHIPVEHRLVDRTMPSRGSNSSKENSRRKKPRRAKNQNARRKRKLVAKIVQQRLARNPYFPIALDD